MTERTVTDLETTALDIERAIQLIALDEDTQETAQAVAAVRELARRAERLGGFPLSRERLLDRIEEAEADRDRYREALEPLRPLFAELDDISLSITDSGLAELLDAIVARARAALATSDTPPTGICPECTAGRHVACLDDGSSMWTDRCECDCGDYPKLRATPDTPPDA